MLKLPQPGEVTVTEVPSDGTRVPSSGTGSEGELATIIDRKGAGIDERGLGPLHRKALALLASWGRPLAARRLASRLGITLTALRTTVEPELERLGLIAATPRGLAVAAAK